MKLKWKKLIWMVPLGILALAVFITLGGEIVLHLWNWLLPSLFGWRQLTFWEALGILLLCRILFGSFGFHNSGRSNVRHRMADRMADRVADRWETMTPEEREQFRQRIRERCDFDPSTSEPKAE